jgi:hypothetical protein
MNIGGTQFATIGTIGTSFQPYNINIITIIIPLKNPSPPLIFGEIKKKLNSTFKI